MNQVRILDPQLPGDVQQGTPESVRAPLDAGGTGGKSQSRDVAGSPESHPAPRGGGAAPHAKTTPPATPPVDRRKTLGASEAPAVLNVDPYRTPHDIYLLKRGLVDEFAGNEATRRGTILEPALVGYAASETGRPIRAQVRKFHPSGLLSATLDAISDDEGDPFIIEAKTTGVVDGWGDDGTDAIPDRVLVQVHHQFVCAGPDVRVAYVPALLLADRGATVRVYKVYRNDRLAEIVESAGLAFMAAVRDGRPPAAPPSLEIIEKIRREPSKKVLVSDALVSRWAEAKAARKVAEDAEDAARRDLLTALGDAEIGESAAGTVTYAETKTSRFNLSAFKKAHPTIAEQFIEQSTYRTLRHKKA